VIAANRQDRLARKLALRRRGLTVRELSLPWAHLSFAQNQSRIKVAVTDWVAVSVYARTANGGSFLIIPSVVTAVMIVAKQFAVGLSVKRIGVIGQLSVAKRVAEPNPVGIASV